MEIGPTDVISLSVERWPKGRRGAGEEIARAKIRPRSTAGVYEVELSYGGVPTRTRSIKRIIASKRALEDLWQLIADGIVANLATLEDTGIKSYEVIDAIDTREVS